LDVAIIGTGFAGLCMAIRLGEEGESSFALLERADDIGGTWRDNVYPGCACDIPSHLYSFSFEQNPEWSRTFPPQDEIQAYLLRCVSKYRLRPHIRFGFEVADARYDEERQLWVVRSTAGERVEARVLVSGTGGLSRPSMPAIPDAARFRGRIFHSACWDESVDVRGKRVAVVGTGASAIQVVPALAASVDRLYVFQRTPPWILPRGDRAFPAWQKELFRRVPLLQRAYRSSIYWRLELGGAGFVGVGAVMRQAETMARRHIERSIADPDLRRLVTPDYAIGCKRILLSNDYYPALARSHVELVPSALVRMTPTGVIGADGVERDVDVVVFATGFSVTDFLAPMRIHGRDGAELGEQWQHGATSYLGLAVAGFPNFFVLTGPNTGLGHNSMVFMIESQVAFVMKALRWMRRNRFATIEVDEGRQRSFSDMVQRKMQGTVWMSGCKSWYLSADGRNYTLWPGFTFDYWARTRTRPGRVFSGRRRAD